MDWPIKVGCDGPPNEMLCTVSVRCGGLQDDDGMVHALETWEQSQAVKGSGLRNN